MFTTKSNSSARRLTKAVVLLAALAGVASPALAQPIFRNARTAQRHLAFEGPGPFTLGSVKVEQIDWAGPFAPTRDSNWGRFTLEFRGREGLYYINVMVGNQWVIRNMGVESPLGVGVPHTVSTFFPIAPQHGIPIEMVQMDLIATHMPLQSPIPAFIPPAQMIDSFFDVFYNVSSNDVMLGAEHPMAFWIPPIRIPDIVLPELPTSGAQLPNQDKVENKPQPPNGCAPGAVSNSLRYLHATGQGNLGTAPISPEGVGGVLGTDEHGTSQTWPTIKQQFFNANPQYRICTKILGGASAAVIAEVVKAIKDGKDVELDLNGHVVFVVGIRVYADRVELDIYDDDQTDDKADPKRTVTLRPNGAGGWTCDGFGVDGFVIESPCPCAADWNHDGVVNQADLALFMAFFQLGLPQADFNGDGIVNTQDVQGFLGAFNVPCP